MISGVYIYIYIIYCHTALSVPYQHICKPGDTVVCIQVSGWVWVCVRKPVRLLGHANVRNAPLQVES